MMGTCMCFKAIVLLSVFVYVYGDILSVLQVCFMSLEKQVFPYMANEEELYAFDLKGAVLINLQSCMCCYMVTLCN